MFSPPWRDGALRPGGLDEERLAFYGLAMHLSLIAGHARLPSGTLGGDALSGSAAAGAR